jgi:hypothetical protein
MFKNAFSRLSGFDLKILEDLDNKSAKDLNLTSLWCLLGILLASLSSGYLVFFSLNSIIASFIVFTIVFLLLLALQIILITATTGNMQLNEEEFENHNLNQYQYLLFILVSFLVAQPLLIFVFSVSKPEFVKNQVDQTHASQSSYQINTAKNDLGRLENTIAENEKYLIQIQSNDKLPNFSNIQSSSNELASNNKKALIIGNQNYLSSPLNNPKKDAMDMSKRLEAMGFSVKSLIDADYFTIESEFQKYIKQLKPNEISLIYFSGHGFQDHGNNYLVPVDFKPSYDRSKAISLSVMIESISQRFPKASIFIIDACRDGMSKSQGLASIEAGQNTYIALASEPGKSSFDDKPGTNGFFTKAILDNISDEVDIDTVFRRVRESVQHKTRNKQLTWTTHNLKSDLILNERVIGSSNLIKYLNASDKSGIPCEEFDSNNYSTANKISLQTCITARLLKSKDDLTELKQINKDIKGVETNNSQDLMLAYSIYLKNFPFRFVLGLILITFFLSGGFILRHRLRKEFFNYEILFHSSQRNIVLKQSKKYITIADGFPFADKHFVHNAFQVLPKKDRHIDSKIIHGKNAIEFLMKSFKKK